MGRSEKYIANFVGMCYDNTRTRQTITVGGFLPIFGGVLLFPPERRGCAMTYEELFLMLSFFVSLATLVFEIFKYFSNIKKK